MIRSLGGLLSGIFQYQQRKRKKPLSTPRARERETSDLSHFRLREGGTLYLCRCRANMAHIRQPRPHYGLDVQVKVLIIFQGALSALGSGRDLGTCVSTKREGKREVGPVSARIDREGEGKNTHRKRKRDLTIRSTALKSAQSLFQHRD